MGYPFGVPAGSAYGPEACEKIISSRAINFTNLYGTQYLPHCCLRQMGLSGETVGHAYYPEEVSKLLADDKKI